MKVRLLRDLPIGKAGRELHVPDYRAVEWIKQGYAASCDLAGAGETSPHARVLDAPQNRVLAKPKNRKKA